MVLSHQQVVVALPSGPTCGSLDLLLSVFEKVCSCFKREIRLFRNACLKRGTRKRRRSHREGIHGQ
jgi:hypothetical protein